MWERSVEPFMRRTASTAKLAKYSRSCERTFELRVVLAIATRSLRKASGFELLSTAVFERAARAAWEAMRFSASRSSSAARTVTEVVPSPISSSWTFEMLTRTFAAALSRAIDLRMVAPILSIPLGPRVVLTRSPTAIAPTKADRRAFSPFSSVTSSAKICVGLLYDWKVSVD
ncbi:hypothetical protein KCU85_g351, partial [Aureobasidium melanogenum]